MGKKIALNHVTHYSYDRLISLGPQIIRLRPAVHCRTSIQSYSLKVEPAQHFINWQQDPFGNYLARVVFPEKTKFFEVEVDIIAEMRVFNPFDFFLEDSAKDFPFSYNQDLKDELAPYLEIKEDGPLLQQYIESIQLKPTPTIDFLVGVNQRLYKDLQYLIRMEPGVQACEVTLGSRSGSCRDMAWLLAQIFRRMGLATRFTSGYLIQLTADEKALDGPSGPDKDFTDLHAWTEVYLPGAGWVGLDPTSGLIAGEGHVPLCCTPNPSSAAPITGILDECESSLEHTMTVTRLPESRTIARPYTDEEWRSIDQLGAEIDEEILKDDVRLTMGGEPTFISVDNRDSFEWTYGALGDEKWQKSLALFGKMTNHYAPQGLVHFGQGKWYPGEVLPRWALGCYWRRDGEPVWADKKLLVIDPPAKKATIEQAKLFIDRLAHVVGVSENHVVAAFEDLPYHLWKEAQLPVEGDLKSEDPYEAAERKRLHKIFRDHVKDPTGYVLPLGYSQKIKTWKSNVWKFSGEKLTLLAGDSPMGLRLPLASLPIVEDKDEEFVVPERSTFAGDEKLPTWTEIQNHIEDRRGKNQFFESDPCGLLRTAICVEPREGILCVFLPPLNAAKQSLELISSIEYAAKDLGQAVRIEGYPPPTDTRLQSFKITPDPGVVEVNIQPTSSWEEQKELITTVYEMSRTTRLAADRFMLDGRKVGTGGGNHIVVGGETPENSPFLRRPDLLKSILTFWQNHPSLSYLFSSLFVGPTSQHPRIDEARHESLYELEIAFNQIDESQGDMPLWLVDRLFRNLLVDITGNTHRTEICIDKLYNPDSESGRLGLIEFRNFEMPPHPKLSLVQSLLLKALITSFWKNPYSAPLERWGTRLHDQFMLPYFVWSDFQKVLQYLHQNGFDFDANWFEPLFEFRFPKIGECQVGDTKMELRYALEPWPVMGEESRGGSVSRSVDSTVERVQLMLKGPLPVKHIVTCNQVELPMHSVSDTVTKISGVRFKAWSAPSSLHPQIKIQAPLSFDVINTTRQHSIGGFTYHVSHPGGRNYEKAPVNENEAEGRRLSRFEANKHSPGQIKWKPATKSIEHPLTLDLRRYI